jgi:phage baseplate assembly protein W|tara:strand:+ start:1133 stop:1555 length:423 start_codon:yes stop_codon:yes gene_type:complete
MSTFQFTDFDIDLNKNPFNDDISIVRDRDAIRQSIMNIVLTVPGEKRFNDDFGVGLRSRLFELWTPLTEKKLQRDIVGAISRLEPRARIDSVVIEEDSSVAKEGSSGTANQFNIKINYSILKGRRTQLTDTLEVTVQKVR